MLSSLDTGFGEDALETAAKFLDVICQYRLRKAEHSEVSDIEGRLGFLSMVYGHVRANSPILMCLHAFPFKSPNSRDKVLGHLPDKAEEFALAHLNGLCAAIGDIYAPGAKLTIVSDGLLLNTFGRSDYDPSTEITKNEDTCQTYRGYIKFLETDLALVYPVGEDNGRSRSSYEKGIEYISKQMLQRGDAFARAVREIYRDHLRLSIHPSTGRTKLFINTLPTTTSFTTPWHCSIAFRLDGSSTTGPRVVYYRERSDLLAWDADVAYYRERSDLFAWDADVACEPIYPSGLMIRPAAGPKTLSIRNVDAAKVRALSERNSPVILRGFTETRNRDLFVDKAHEFGTPLPWQFGLAHEFGTPLPWKFGLVLEVKDQGADSRGLNNVLSAEWMPFHFDGLFKTEKKVLEDGTERMLPKPPKFQFFTAVTPSPKDTGFTLFTPSRLVFQNLPAWLPPSRLSQLTWRLDLTGEPCFRYHEPWPQSKTTFDATDVAIEGVSAEESAEICAALDALLRDRRNTLWHSWENGDLLVSDNTMAMHTRSDFKSGAPRELWRIHFD
ncbi:Isocyanide synthase xanB like protein [Verticillium longisporum]|nr:Isocyanide synthase xanB like protein [Verticillium longisporum]